ncbi:hypothetical protein BGZ80_009060, partial [Entomortierella chlamydospora]
WEYFLGLHEVSKHKFYNALLKTFLGNTSTADFEWDFVDLGLIYRLKGDLNSTKNRILCPPVQKALLKVFMDMPLTKDIMDRANLGNISGQELEQALLVQFITSNKPIVLTATDLVNANPTPVTFNFEH